jgi:hypothetical protein
MQNFAGGGNFVLLQYVINNLLCYEKFFTPFCNDSWSRKC